MNFKQPIYFLSILAFISMLLLAACGSGGSGTDKNSAEFDEANKNLKQSIEEVVYGIPSPSEIPYMIQQTGAEFNQGLVNPITNAERYTRRNDKAALNLGVYAADIGYLSSYDKTQEAIDYLNSCKNLADILGVIGTFDMEILKRFEANISNKDSLTSLLDQTLKQTERLLKDDSRNRLAALVVTGSFIEGLYISTGLVNSYPKNLLPDDSRNLILTPIIQVILNQKKSVSELLKMLSSVEQTEPVAGIVTDLQELEKAYAALNIEEQIRNNRADMVLSDKNLTQISSIVSKIRKGITE
ncbi:MAG: hypothetical protein L6Q51_07380 [Cyclobacteriaceae bacterium]|nr:hypothetical protein [Cyclobacteriaceae bacterium]